MPMSKPWNALKSVALTLSLSLVLGMAILLATQSGWAATTPAASITDGEGMKVLYSARFDWKGSPLRFDLAALTRVEEGKSRFVAFIKDTKGETHATCERSVAGAAPFDVNSMTLSCEGKLFGKGTGQHGFGKRTAKFSYSDALSAPRLLIEGGTGERKDLELKGT